MHSIKGTTLVTPEEKRSMSKKIKNENTILSMKENLNELKDTLFKETYNLINLIDKTFSTHDEFEEIFKEKVEKNASFYNPNEEQLKTIQSIFVEKNSIMPDLISIRDTSNDLKLKYESNEDISISQIRILLIKLKIELINFNLKRILFQRLRLN